MNPQHAPAAPFPRPAWFDTCDEWRAPRPDELICFAALHSRADIMLQDAATLERVANAYIEHCRKLGYWAHSPSRKRCPPFHKSGEEGYRDRVADYQGVLRWHLANVAPLRKAS